MSRESRVYYGHKVYPDGWKDPFYDSRGLFESDLPQTVVGLRSRAQHQCMLTIVEGARSYVKDVKNYVKIANVGAVRKFKRLVAGMEKALVQLESLESQKQAKIEAARNASTQKLIHLEREAEKRRRAPLWIDPLYGPVFNKPFEIEKSYLFKYSNALNLNPGALKD
jgi:hypothetical protein